MGKRAHQKRVSLASVVSLGAIVATIVLISWARIQVHGTGDIEAALEIASLQADCRSDEESAVDAAVTTSRWATGLSP